MCMFMHMSFFYFCFPSSVCFWLDPMTIQNRLVGVIVVFVVDNKHKVVISILA